MSTGKIVQVIGAVVDIEFPEDAVPKINDALVADGYKCNKRGTYLLLVRSMKSLN